jgi:hypothetical protein
MHQPDPEFGTRPQQPGIDKSGPVVHVGGGGRDAAGGQRRFQRGGQAHGVLGEPEPVAHRETRMIVQEREQVRFSATDSRPVQRITHPPLVRCRSLEPAEHHPGASGGAHQLAAVKQPQQRGLRGRIATGGPQDPGDLRGGAVWVLPLERHRQLQHPGVDAGAGLADRRGQGIETAGAVSTNPAIQAVTGVTVLPTERALMDARGDRPHHPAPRLGRQASLQRGTNQLIAEQRHLLRPRPACHAVLLVPAHHENLNSPREYPAQPAGQ